MLKQIIIVEIMNCCRSENDTPYWATNLIYIPLFDKIYVEYIINYLECLHKRY